MLTDQLRTRMKEAMKAKKTVEKDVLRTALGEIQIAEAREGKTLSDQEGQRILKKLIKSNSETLEVSSDPAVKAKLSEENQVLESFLPQTLSVDQIVAALGDTAEALRTAKSDGQATGIAMKALKASGAEVDGKDVAQAVRQIRIVPS